MRTLITGASGFIGRRLWQQNDLRLMRTDDKHPDTIVGDLLDIPSLIAACDGIECVFHCAGYAHAFSSADSDAHWRINFEGTRNLLNAAVSAGVKRFVFLSSIKAMAEPGNARVDEDWPGQPLTSYGKAKRAAEDLVLDAGAKYGLHVVNLRLAMVYGRGGRGNLERMASGIRAGWFPPLPETGNHRSLVHVNDVVAALRRVADAPQSTGRTYIVANEMAYSGREIYDQIRAVLQMPSPRWRAPARLLRYGGGIGDFCGALLSRSIPINSEAVERLLGSAWYSPARIEKELGWRSQIGLAEGLLEMLG